jgi:hypothetical protein
MQRSAGENRQIEIAEMIFQKIMYLIAKAYVIKQQTAHITLIIEFHHEKIRRDIVSANLVPIRPPTSRLSFLENKMAYHSAPHGAGRRFSRGETRRRFNMEDFKKAMAGIECRHSAKLIDELPMAYKDIDEVMENSKELVKVDHTLKQIVNVKGD